VGHGSVLGDRAPGDARRSRAALALPPDAPIVGIVATLRSWKGHRYLLEAVAGMSRRDVFVLIVGDGPQRAALEALAAELGLGERVRFAEGSLSTWASKSASSRWATAAMSSCA